MSDDTEEFPDIDEYILPDPPKPKVVAEEWWADWTGLAEHGYTAPEHFDAIEMLAAGLSVDQIVAAVTAFWEHAVADGGVVA